MYPALLKFFHAIIDQDPLLLTAVQSYSGELQLQDAELRFTLPALYDFLIASIASKAANNIVNDATNNAVNVASISNADITPQEPEPPSYQGFRAMLYASELNRDLQRLGYRVDVDHSTGKVDSSAYRLVKI